MSSLRNCLRKVTGKTDRTPV